MNNHRQIAAFESNLRQAQSMLNRIAQYLNDHLAVLPDDVTWTDVGTAMKIENEVKNLSDFLFNEGEYEQ